MTNFMKRTAAVVLFLLFILSMIPLSTAFGRDIYVDNVHGNDSFLGFNMRSVDTNGPVRSIARALQLAQQSDRIILANNPEPYRESVLLSGEKNSGAPNFPFRIEGNGATLDGTEPIPADYWRALGTRGIFVCRPLYVAHQNLFYRGKPVKRIDASHIHDFNTLMAQDWKPMRWCLYDGEIYFKPREAFMVRDDAKFLPYDDSEAAKKRTYALSCTKKQHGIALFQVHHVEISNLIVQGFQNDGIIASNMATGIQLNNVTCRGNARAGLVNGTGSSVWLKDCVLGNNQYAQLLTEENSLTSIFSSDLISYPAPAWIENGDGGTVYRDRKRIDGGLNEPQEDTCFEDEPGYFETIPEEEKIEEVDVGDVGDDDDDDDDDDDGGLFGNDSKKKDDAKESDTLFGGDDDASGDEDDDATSGDDDDDAKKEEDDGLFGGGGDDDDSSSDDSSSDDSSSDDDSGGDDEDSGGFSF